MLTDNFLGVIPDTAGLSVGACNSTQAVLARQGWSCLDDVDCKQPSRVLATGHAGCERLRGFIPPLNGTPTSCCLTFLADGAGFGLQQCWHAGMPAQLSAAQHFTLAPVAGGGSGGGGPVRFSLQLAAGPTTCVGAQEAGYALPRTLALYQNWSAAAM